MDQDMQFTLAPRDDLDQLRQTFLEERSVSISQFLPDEQAHILAQHIEERQDWLEVFLANGKTYEMPADAFDALGTDQKAEIDRLVAEEARKGFQFRYRTVRVPDDRTARSPESDLLHGFAEFLNSEETLELLRDITGEATCTFADSQATAYQANHFLTSHDDGVEGKGRLTAYVFSLTEHWLADWGGLLVFPKDGELSGYIPGFNSLRIFAVPRPHCVTSVATFVTETRYSVTGWMRDLSL